MRKNYFLLNDFRYIYDRYYQYFLPILLLILLTIFQDFKWAILAVILFPFFFNNIVNVIKSLISGLINFVYVIMHHVISTILLLFGINLKKRNQSVLEFFGFKKNNS